jgi:hypothetical protein
MYRETIPPQGGGGRLLSLTHPLADAAEGRSIKHCRCSHFCMDFLLLGEESLPKEKLVYSCQIFCT